MSPEVVALIPARSGSKRIPNKNIKALGGHPLMAYSIVAAIQSGVFSKVVCATDSEEYASVARHYGAYVPKLRPDDISGDHSPDIVWVKWALSTLSSNGFHFDAFSILRPTNPFRLPSTIVKAWNLFRKSDNADSLRAVQKCSEHPGKMWVLNESSMTPFLPWSIDNVPWHSNQYASLPDVYVQNASLEIAWSRVALERDSISGSSIVPFISEGFEGHDLNNLVDWVVAEDLIHTGKAQLPAISITPPVDA